MNFLIQTTTTTPPSINIGGIDLYLLSFGGVFASGPLATAGYFMSLFFTFILVVWVGISIYAGLKIISSNGNSDTIETGTKSIRNIWTGIAIFLAFFAAVSLLGVFLGYGNIYEWSTKLAQCKGNGGQFYYQWEDDYVQNSSDQKTRPTGMVACCATGSVGPLTGYEWTELSRGSQLPANCPFAVNQ